VADALTAMVTTDTAIEGKAFNLCARVPLSAREIVEAFRIHTGRALHFHGRPLWLMQAGEIGKWMIKRAGRRPGVVFPAWRDLKGRELNVRFTSSNARDLLGWTPIDDRDRFLDVVVRAPLS
jgi:hypothetical protein